MQPPIATTLAHTLETHDHVRVDEYYWLRERDNPEVIAYLEAENAYTEEVMGGWGDLEERVFEEMRGRIKEDDSSVPYRLRDYFYYTRFEEGQEYPVYARKRDSLESPEEVMLDVNELAEGHDFYQVGNLAVSSGQGVLAYAVDTGGRRIYTIHFRDLLTGEFLEERIDSVTANLTWAEDDRTLLYARQDPETLRSFQIFRHEFGTPQSEDVLVYQEDDDEFSTAVFKTKSRSYLMIGSYQTLSSEYRYVDATDPGGTFRVVEPRGPDHEYDVDHMGDRFYIRTNDGGATNFKLMEAQVSNPGRDNWTELIPHREDTYLAGFELFRDHLVLSERFDALTHLRIIPWDGSSEHYLDFGEPAYRAGVSVNPDLDTSVLRYSYTSMTTPGSVFDYDMNARERTLLKQTEVLGGFSSDDYRTERLWATATDGTRVPVSVVYKRGLELDGSNPTVLYAYGSYGSSTDATFSSARLSLLDRGFIWAIAHVRGGQEMGRRWYDDGKLLKKKNSFTDFIDVGRFLVEEGYTRPDRLFAYGGSAGGLLVGVVANMAPELFHGIVAAVPFVDVVTTMLDETIPLTTFEYDEWGNPNDPEYFDYMLSYSPYDNVEAKDYPHLLVTAGLSDSQVQYWEPAKWVAKLRTLKTDQNLLLLKTNMDAGHGGASGRFERLREAATDYAFFIQLGT